MNIWVLIPTYNEAENIGLMIKTLISLHPGLSIVVVDDDSPDGTSTIVQEWQKKYPQLHLLLRKGERGRGSAGLAGFSYILQRLREESAENKNNTAIIEMDADFSHNPEYIGELVTALGEADLVLGSRSVTGGADLRDSFLRKTISLLANSYLKSILSLPVEDCTSGFRAFRREVLEAIKPASCISKGPEVVSEILFKAHRLGFEIKEIPIVFPDRARGRSTFNLVVAIRGLLMPLVFRVCYHIRSIVS